MFLVSQITATLSQLLCSSQVVFLLNFYLLRSEPNITLQWAPSGEPLQGYIRCIVSLMSKAVLLYHKAIVISKTGELSVCLISSIEVGGLYKCYIKCECVFLHLHKCSVFPISIHSLNTVNSSTANLLVIV